MPLNITDSTPRKPRTIGGILVHVPQPYAEGQPLTSAMAQMLNQTLAENFSNNLREKITKYKDGDKERVATPAEAQVLVNDYAGKYEPGVRTGGGGARALSPVEKEMRAIATEKLLGLLKEQGLKKADVDFNELRDQIVEDHKETLQKQAERIIAQRSKDTGIDLSKLKIAKAKPAPAAEVEEEGESEGGESDEESAAAE